MFVYSMFPTDCADDVMQIQHDAYPSFIGILGAEVTRIVEHAGMVLRDEQTEIGKFFAAMDGFDHRILQDVHDRIAGWYRFTYFRLSLFRTETNADGELSRWHKFALNEFRESMKSHTFASGCIDALMFANEPRGRAGEKAMSDYQERRYSAMFTYRLPGGPCFNET